MTVSMLRDAWVGLRIVIVIVAGYGILPLLVLNRHPGRRWWPEAVGGSASSLLATTLVVPLLARVRLLNWATCLIVSAAWPAALWIYRARGAPLSEYRAAYRRLTLWSLSRRWHPRSPRALGVPTVAAALFVVLVFSPSILQLRLGASGDYAILARARTLLGGGVWTFEPVAAVTAVVSRVAAVDAMQVVRFLRPLLIIACAGLVGIVIRSMTDSTAASLAPLGAAALARFAPSTIGGPSTTVLWLWSSLAAALALAIVGSEGVHRQRWYVAGAALLALSAAPAARGANADTHPIEYEAAARIALHIARTMEAGTWTIAAPPEQALEIPDQRSFLDLAAFVHHNDSRAGLHEFRFGVPTRALFVFVERRPLPTMLEAGTFFRGDARYSMPNARARLEREAWDLCERYRRTHTRATVYYDDDNLRVYEFRR